MISKCIVSIVGVLGSSICITKVTEQIGSVHNRNCVSLVLYIAAF